MRGLLLVGGIVLGIVLVAASPQDQAESQIEAKNESAQGDFVNDREIRSTDGKKKKTKPARKLTPGLLSAMSRPSDTLVKRVAFVNDRKIRSTDGGNKKKTRPGNKPKPGVFGSLARPSNTREIRSIDESIPQRQEIRRRCPGCYSSVHSVPTEKNLFNPSLQQQRPKGEDLFNPSLRRQRDTEEHEKLKKKHKHLKEKSKTRRRNKNHKERHAHFQGEDPAIGDNNNKRRKYHRGKKDKEQRRSGRFSAISSVDPNMNKMNMDLHDTQDMTE